MIWRFLEWLRILPTFKTSIACATCGIPFVESDEYSEVAGSYIKVPACDHFTDLPEEVLFDGTV